MTPLTWHDGVVQIRAAAAGCVIALLPATGLMSAASPTSSVPDSVTSSAMATMGVTSEPDTSPEPTALERDDVDDLLAVITKDEPISPLDYAPEDLTSWPGTDFEVRAEVREHLEALFAAAQDDERELRVISGYRSYDTQAGTYDWWRRHYGRASADATSARPGHSEHQSGLAVDLDSTTGECYLNQCFGDTAEGRWVAEHAHEFGFVISYPAKARVATGYAYEPWHIRYVGPHVATDMWARGIVLLLDYVGVPASSARTGESLGSRG